MLFHGDAQAFDGQRILRPDVDVTVIGADGIGGDAHALEHGMRDRLRAPHGP